MGRRVVDVLPNSAMNPIAQWIGAVRFTTLSGRLAAVLCVAAKSARLMSVQGQ
jgi:hypothetical protein